MDVTPKLLEDVEFREKFRGYDPEEVDDFLERVAIAFGQLHERLRDTGEQIEAANARAARAEARARASADTDDVLRRTLVLAQRTADAAIKEAEESAAAIVSVAEAQAREHELAAEERSAELLRRSEESAKDLEIEAGVVADVVRRGAEAEAEATRAKSQDQAGRLLIEAKQKAERLVIDSESAAIRHAEEKLTRLTEEIAVLERRREALAHDANALDAHTSVQRERLHRALVDLRRLAEESTVLGQVPMPVLRSESFDDVVAAHMARVAPPAVASAPPTQEEVTPEALPMSSAPASEAGSPWRVASEAVVTDEAAEDADALSVESEPDIVISGIDAAAGSVSPSIFRTMTTSTAEASNVTIGVPDDLAIVDLVEAGSVQPQVESGIEEPPTVSRLSVSPPPPPPPPPSSRVAAGVGAEAAMVPPAPPTPAPTFISANRDPFLEELRRAVGEEPEDDDAIRFFEDRDPTDPALRFFEEPDDTRSRFRRR